MAILRIPRVLLPTGVDAVLRVLTEARRLGFLGPGPIEEHVGHTTGFVEAVAPPSGSVLDLGSGAGVPGLILAVLHWTEAHWVLLDANRRRAEFVRRAVDRLGLGDRVRVLQERAENAGRETSLRYRFDLVVARAFGPPAVTAECASPFLHPGGRLLVSEPPSATEGRWPASGLTTLGLRSERRIESRSGNGTSSVQLLNQIERCPDRFARRVGVPGKRPLW